METIPSSLVNENCLTDLTVWAQSATLFMLAWFCTWILYVDSPTERIITLRITSERITSERINTECITS